MAVFHLWLTGPSNNSTSQIVSEPPKAEKVDMAREFQLPGMTEQETDVIYPLLKTKAQEIALQITDRKITRVLYKRNGKLFNMKVGALDPIKGEPVIAIIEGHAVFLVFTMGRGITHGDPCIIGNYEILAVDTLE
jgi:hypothetical protein